MTGLVTAVTPEMRADLSWFVNFCSQWNGVSIIPKPNPDVEIAVDASLTGIGASDGNKAYALKVCGDHQVARNIAELEAVNIAIALHSLIDKSHIGSHVRVLCDNLVSVQIKNTGKGRNPVMLEVARTIWMLQAHLNIAITYEHIPGHQNIVADALSRAHLAPSYAQAASEIVSKYSLNLIKPCLYIFDIINHNIFL